MVQVLTDNKLLEVFKAVLRSKTVEDLKVGSLGIDNFFTCLSKYNTLTININVLLFLLRLYLDLDMLLIFPEEFKEDVLLKNEELVEFFYMKVVYLRNIKIFDYISSSLL